MFILLLEMEIHLSSLKSIFWITFQTTTEPWKSIFTILISLFDRQATRMKNYAYEPMIAIIPARSGSKGLKDKNIRELNGKPLLAYTVEAAVSSGLFETVHVSTDSQEYADIASAYGADEPFLRDRSNAGDTSSSWDAVREVLAKYKSRNKEFKTCFLLQPTSPMRTAEDLLSAYILYRETNAASLTSVTEVDHPVQWCFRIDKQNTIGEFAFSPYKNSRRQDLEKYYRENGAIYITQTSSITDPGFDFYSESCVAYVMDRIRSIDIDTLQDFVVAETIMKMESD